MERVTTGVEVVDDDLDNLILLQDKRMRVFAVYPGVVGHFAGTEGCVERGDLGERIGDVVEEGVVGTITEVVHDDIKLHGSVGLWEEFHAIVGFERHVVEGG